MALITYENKVKINDSSLPAVNKVRDVDMNEIKEVVNENYMEQQDIQTQINTLTTYSTQEKIVGKWIDGNDIYEKTLVVNNPTLNAVTDVQNNIENADMLVIKEMFVYRIDTHTTRSINIAESNTTIMSQGARTYISYRIPADIWGWSVAPSQVILYAVLKYTKITN